MPVSKKRKDIKHLSGTGRCKTIKGKQLQNGCYHINIKLIGIPFIPVGKAGKLVRDTYKQVLARYKELKASAKPS